MKDKKNKKDNLEYNSDELEEDNKHIKEFVSGGGAVFIAKIVGYIFAFLFKVILARHYGPDEYGLFEMSITLIGFASTFAALGLKSSVSRFIPEYRSKDKKKIKGLIKVIIGFQLLSSLIISFIFVSFAESITKFFDFPEAFTPMIFTLSIALPISILSKDFKSILNSYKKIFVGKFGSNILKYIILLIGAIFVTIFNQSMFVFIIFIVISYLGMLIYYLYHFIPLSKEFRNEKAEYEIPRWLSYSIPLLFAGIIGKLIGWSDNLVIARFLTEGELGIYAVSFSVAYYLFIGSIMFSTQFLPIMTEVYQNSKKNFINLFQRIRNWSVLVSLCVGSVFILYANQILLFLFGRDYIAGASSLQILSLFFIITNYFYFSSKILNLEEDTKKILYGDIITLVLNLIITIYLVIEIGILGAAIGSGFSRFLIKYIFHLMSKKYIKISHDYIHILKSTILTFSSAFISYFITNTIFRNISIHFIFYIVLAGLIYSILLLLGARYLKIFDKKDLIVLDYVEKYTKLNLNFFKNFLIK